MNNVILLVARIFLAVIFILAGFGKLADPGTVENAFSTAGMIAGRSLPAPVVLAYLAGLLELAGGLAVLVGFQTRIASWALALFSVAAALLFHLAPTGDAGMDMINQIMLLKNFSIAGGFLVLALHGAGALSVDARRGMVPVVA
jgi:putative oxidoreductase